MVSKAIKYKEIERQALKLEQGKPGHPAKQKVVFVLPTLLAGGAERVLLTLMNGLDRSRFAPELVVMSDKGPLRDWIASDIPFHSLGNVRVSRGLHKLLRRLNKIEPDIIVSTMAAMNYGVLMIKPFLKKKARVIVREAVVPSSIAENQKAPWIVKAAYQRLYPRADMVVSPARCIVDEFESYLGMSSDRHMILHNPVDIHKIRSEQIIQGEPDEERKTTTRFVCAGRLQKQKGFDRLIEALPAMLDQKWTLNIMGVGAEEQALKALIKKHGLEDRVFLDGLVKHPWPQIAMADCFLLPSRWEGLPNVVLESLAAGTPVIGVREAGGIQEIADMSVPGAVSVVDSVSEMIELMRQVSPKPTTVFRPSLLPQYFHLDQVEARFARLLEGAVEADVSLLADDEADKALPKQYFGRRRNRSPISRAA